MKGISPLLAAVILVALTISIAFIASSSISTLTQRQVSTASTQGSASSNVIVVKEVACKNNTDNNAYNISFIVKNIGPENITGLAVAYKIGNEQGIGMISITLSPGALQQVNFNTGINANTTKTLKYLQVCSQSPSGICVEKSETDLGVTCS